MPKSTDSAEVCPSAELELGGEFRMTKQRREVYEVLMAQRDHPTAAEVYDRAKAHMAKISLATVYNCLETLSSCGLVKQVNVAREPTRYCANLKEHGHFCCEECGEVTDVELKAAVKPSQVLRLPKGSIANQFDVAIKGVCPKCAATKKKN